MAPLTVLERSRAWPVKWEDRVVGRPIQIVRIGLDLVVGGCLAVRLGSCGSGRIPEG
jgi:hypothetical protein